MINVFDTDTERKMRAIVCFAYKHNPFYHQLYNKNGIDVNTCMLPDALPLVSQNDLVYRSLQMKSNIPLYRICTSSGTKNSPKFMFRSQDDFQSSVKNQIQLMKWCGVKPDDVVGIVQPSGLWGYANLTQEAARQMGVLSVQMGNAEDILVLELIFKLGITVLDIAPSRLRSLLKLYENRNFPCLRLKVAMCSGEKLTNDFRIYVMKKYRIPIYDQYGSEETDALGGEISPGNQITLFIDDFYFEITDCSGRPVVDGETGSLIVTSLYHKGTPLIRYQLEDSICIVSQEQNRVQIIGRNKDYVVLYDSVKLYPFHLQDILDHYLKDPSDWQCRIINQAHQIIAEINIHTEQLTQTRKNKLIHELSRASIDIAELCKNGILYFIITQADFIFTGRGKRHYILDLRTVK